MENAGPFLVVVIGLVSLGGVILLVLKIYNESRKAFGKRPPVDEELDTLDGRIGALEKLPGELLRIKEDATKLDRDFDMLRGGISKMELDLMRAGEQRKDEMIKILSDANRRLWTKMDDIVRSLGRLEGREK